MSSRRLLRDIRPALPLEVVHLSQRISDPKRYRELRQRREWVAEDMNGYSVQPFLEAGALFVHIPKCAGVSLVQSLFGCMGGAHASLDDYQIIFDPAEYRSLWKFTFVRNPWDRLVSAYNFLRAGGMNDADRRRAALSTDRFDSFNAFVHGFVGKEDMNRAVHFRPQYRFVCLSETAAPGVDFIGRFERIEEDFEVIRKRLGRDVVLVPANRTRSRPAGYRDQYTDETAAIVARVYARDVALFGYSF